MISTKPRTKEEQDFIDGTKARELLLTGKIEGEYVNLSRRVLELERENSFLRDQAVGFEAHTHDLTAKLEKRTNQLLLLVDKYADIVSCKYCPLYKECTDVEQIDADPILCGMLITEWLEKVVEEAGE
jgi:hypothetical protein